MPGLCDLFASNLDSQMLRRTPASLSRGDEEYKTAGLLLLFHTASF